MQQRDPGFLRSRMSIHIGKGFLNDAENRSLQFAPKRGECRRLDIQRSHDAAALGQPIQIPAQGGEQSDFIQQRRVQKVRQTSNLLDSTIDRFAGIPGCAPVGLNRVVLQNPSIIIFAAASSCPKPSCSSLAMRRRSSSCMVSRRPDSRRRAAVLSSTSLSNSAALSRIDCSSNLLS